MTNKQCILQNDNELFLLRFVKPTHIEDSEPLDEVFQLREDLAPPEEFVSFFRFEDDDINDRFRSFTSFMSKKRKMSINSGVIHIDANEACSEINTPRELIKFKDCNAPHYGLFFLSESDEDRLETKTMLLFCSSFKLTRDINPSVTKLLV